MMISWIGKLVVGMDYVEKFQSYLVIKRIGEWLDVDNMGEEAVSCVRPFTEIGKHKMNRFGGQETMNVINYF